MSRSGYTESDGDYDTADMLRMYGYQANVNRHIAGRAGQKFLWELYLALEALPKRELITDTLMDKEGAYCALGAVARYRNIAIPAELGTESHDEYGDPYDDCDFYDAAASLLNIRDLMAREVMYVNDECGDTHEVPGPTTSRYGSAGLWRLENEEERWARMRRWVVSRLKDIP